MNLGLFAKLHRIFMKTDVSPANIDFTLVEKNKTKISLELGLETMYSKVEQREGRLQSSQISTVTSQPSCRCVASADQMNLVCF